MTQPRLIPPTESEQIVVLKDALKKRGRHSIYCCWVRDGGYYDRSLGCTCGLSDVLDEEEGHGNEDSGT